MASKYSVSFSDAVIETTVTDKGATVHEWVTQLLQSTNVGDKIIVGLDCEWKPTFSSFTSNKTATLQLCVGTKTLIVQLFYVDFIPRSLEDFLCGPNVTVVGVEVEDDVPKLRAEYGLRCGSSADIQAKAMARWPVVFMRKPGLKALARRLVGLHMEKPIHVCRSNWESRILSLEQVQYACIDAYASYKIGHYLLINGAGA
ncbi:3'-5' exonuclease-like [Henckelia pumila]|uniref:3'-5' exonuclease-like n=1 Tax=Henckelia pumila TaxID=405737 RepID=UPI003C6DCE10